MDVAKDRAVDYAFYASDAWDDFKETFSDQTQTVSDRVKDAASRFAADPQLKPKTDSDEDSDDSLRDELADVSPLRMMIRMTLFLNSEDTFGGADVADEPTTPVDEHELTPKIVLMILTKSNLIKKDRVLP